MKCPKCGADIPEGKFYCEKCGEALQIVPDYNPAEDITIGEEDNNIQNKDSSDVSSGEQRSDRKQRFFYLLKKYGPFALVLSIAGIITYWTSYQSTFHQDAVTEVAEELESETEQLLEVPSLSLPQNPLPLSFARIRERLALQSAVGEQNRIIKKAIEQLKTIGYLDCSIEKKGRESFVIVHSRNPKLKLPE